MHNPALLAVFALGIFSFIVFNIVSRTFYKNRHGDKYHFYNMFPYEFNYPSVFKENPYGNFLFILSSAVIAAFYVINPYADIAQRIIAIAFTMMLICLIMMPLYYLKTHLALSCTTMVLAMVLPLLNFFSLKSFIDHGPLSTIQNVMAITSLVISGLLSLAMLLFILNPKLSFKIYYDKTVDADGNEVLKRPKVIFLAFNEWMSIFIYFLSPLGLLLFALVA